MPAWPQVDWDTYMYVAQCGRQGTYMYMQSTYYKDTSVIDKRRLYG